MKKIKHDFFNFAKFCFHCDAFNFQHFFIHIHFHVQHFSVRAHFNVIVIDDSFEMFSFKIFMIKHISENAIPISFHRFDMVQDRTTTNQRKKHDLHVSHVDTEIIFVKSMLFKKDLFKKKSAYHNIRTMMIFYRRKIVITMNEQKKLMKKQLNFNRLNKFIF